MIQEASITGLLNTILIIILVYYVLKYAAKFFGPMLFKYAVNKVEKKVADQYKQQQTQTQYNQNTTSENKKPSTDGLGEYVDYEEVED